MVYLENNKKISLILDYGEPILGIDIYESILKSGLSPRTEMVHIFL